MEAARAAAQEALWWGKVATVAVLFYVLRVWGAGR